MRQLWVVIVIVIIIIVVVPFLDLLPLRNACAREPRRRRGTQREACNRRSVVGLLGGRPGELVD